MKELYVSNMGRNVFFTVSLFVYAVNERKQCSLLCEQIVKQDFGLHFGVIVIVRNSIGGNECLME